MLCQVCAEPADCTDDGRLWLLPADHMPDDDGWTDGTSTVQPPVCQRCARLSIAMCPALRTGHVVVRAHSRVVGVTGVVFQPVPPFPRMVATDYADLVAFTDVAARWTLATQLVRVLFDITRVDPASLTGP